MEEESFADSFDCVTGEEGVDGEDSEELETGLANPSSIESDTGSADSVNQPTVVNLGKTPPLSDLDLLQDYVIVFVEQESRTSFKRTNTPYPLPDRKVHRKTCHLHETRYDYELINMSASDDGSSETLAGELADEEGNGGGNVDEVGGRHVYLPQVTSDHPASSSTSTVREDDRSDGEDEINQETESDAEGEDTYSDCSADGTEYGEEEEEDDAEEDNDYVDDENVDAEDDNDYDAEEEDVDAEDDDYDSVDEGLAEPPNDGVISPARALGSRMSYIYSSLYKTDGEDLNDVFISRSFAAQHRHEMIEAGAKTIGELFVCLKRKKAQEIAASTDNESGTSSSQLINKRSSENEKLKNKCKQKLPKSTVPFEEKQPHSKTRQLSALDAPSPNTSVTINSEIHVEPEVRGDMGSSFARASMATEQSTESLTPESLTRLCETETGHQSEARNKSINSQHQSDIDSRSGFVSGRKNPQTKVKAKTRESGKSRIPQPVKHHAAQNRKMSPKPEPTEQGTEKSYSKIR